VRTKLLTLRYAPGLGAIDDRPLTEFLRDKQVLAIREHFFVVHEVPHMACLVLYEPAEAAAPAPPRAAPPPSGPPAVESLSEGDRLLYDSLRQWRLERSRKDGVPPYVILTNRELAAVVTAKPCTPNALLAVPGIGAGKVERYGAEILARLPRPAEPKP
jgi:superfamily II DNA helicase RecQ